MMYKKHTIILSKKQRAILTEIAATALPSTAMPAQPATVMPATDEARAENAHSHTKEVVQVPLRAQIILDSADGVRVRDIAGQAAVSMSMVYIWRRRWREMAGEVNAAEKLGALEEDDQTLRQMIYIVLGRTNYRKITTKVTDEQVAQIVELAQRPPRAYGIDVDFWTMKTLATAAMRFNIVEQISATKLSYRLRAINFEPSV